MKKRLCVVVPAYNEEVVIEATLRALIAAGVEPEDIYVVDDCSKDRTGEITKSLGARVLRNNPNIGKALGVERVVREFQLVTYYEFIALMDADTLVDVTYFEEMLKEFEKPILTKPNYRALKVDMKIMGYWNREMDELLKRDDTTLDDIPRLPIAVRNKYEVVVACGRPISVAHNWLTAYRALCYANGHYVYREAQGQMGMICIAPGCSTIYRSSRFSVLNWRNGTSAEDMFVTIQVHHEKLGKVAYATKAKVYTQTPRTLRGYMKQMLRWYGGTWEVIRRQRVYWKNDLVDWECKLLWTEGFIMAIVRLLMPIVALAVPFLTHESPSFPWWLQWAFFWAHDISWITDVPWYLGMVNTLAAFIVGSYLYAFPAICVFAWLERRWDIVRYSPMYPVMWYIDAFFFLRAFWEAIILKKTIPFISPPRYV